jgi:photosystem II stability/assembly factor-like uncharacterized protein
VDVEGAETLGAGYYVRPVQPVECSAQVFYPPLPYYYEQGFPLTHYDGVSQGYSSTFRIASFNLRPVLYTQEGGLVKAQRLTYTLHTSPSPGGFGGLVPRRRSSFCTDELRKLITSTVENPEDTLWGYPVPIEDSNDSLQVTDLPSQESHYVDCIVLTEDAAAPTYRGYADFWTERGVVAAVRTVGWVNEHYEGRDLAERIRNFVKAAYLDWGTGFAILAGWQTNLVTLGVPTRLIRQGNSHVTGYDGWATTDLYFSDLEGTWDENENDTFADPAEPLDQMSSMYFTGPSRGCATSPTPDYGTYAYWTADGGNSWHLSATQPPGNAVMTDMHFPLCSEQVGYCVGRWLPPSSPNQFRSFVYKTTNGGVDWHVPCPGLTFTELLRSVYFTDQDNGWVVGDRGLMLRTSDGGLSWFQHACPVGAVNLNDVEFSRTDPSLGCIAAFDGHVLCTTNAGADWTAVQLPGNHPLALSVTLPHGAIGWAAGRVVGAHWSENAIWQTTDGGLTWLPPEQVGLSSELFYHIVAVANPLTDQYDVWATKPNKIYHCVKPSPGNWVLQYSGAAPTSIAHIQFVDNMQGSCARMDKRYSHLVTIDGGDNWHEYRTGLVVGDTSVYECLPEVVLARLPTRPGNAEENTVVRKLTVFQTNPPQGHLRKVKFFAGRLLTKHLETVNQPWYLSHDLQTQLFSSFGRDDFLAAVNDGSQFFCHHFHAGHSYWQGNIGNPWSERLLTEDFENGLVMNGDEGGLAHGNGCHALYMLEDCSIGRHFLICPTGGAVAYGGAANESSDNLYLHLIERIYRDGIYRLGPAYSATITALRGDGRDRAMENLLGDPLMEIWTAGENGPREMSVNLSHSWVPPEPTTFTVTVKDNGVLLGGAKVCVSMRDPTTKTYCLYYVKVTNENGQAVFTLDPKQTGEAKVTVTMHNYLPKVATCHVGLLSDDPMATANNQQRNIVRVPGSSTLHLVYTNAGCVLHSASYDDGQSWTRPDLIDAGEYPCITLNNDATAPTTCNVPWIVYKQGPDIKAAILRAGLPIAYVTVFDGSEPEAVAGPPAVAAKYVTDTQYPAAWATYEVVCDGITQTEYRIHATLFTALGPSCTDILDQQPEWECWRPTIAITPGDIIHVAWQRQNNTTGSNIYYRQFTDVWTPEFPVVNAMPTPGNPFVEAYGDSVFVEFASGSDIQLRPRCVNNLYWDWGFIRNVSNTLDPSDRPAMSTREVSVWQEEVDGVGDVYINIAGEVSIVTSTIAGSAYPSVDAKTDPWTGEITASIVWTEEIDPQGPLYEVRFAERNWLPHDGPARGSPAFYAVATGESLPSPYCQYRSGAVRFGPYSLDFGRDSLRYMLPYLNPAYDYYVRAIVYHEGQGRWTQGIRFQDTLARVVNFEPGKPETVWVQVPVRTYLRDAVADLGALRYNGKYSVMTDFAIFQAEPNRRQEGGQKDGAMALTLPFRATLLPPAPNPFTRTVQCGFALNQPGKVCLRVYDASGRAVRTLARGEQAAGRHLVCWDGRDDQGRVLSNGIYVAKLTSESGSEVRKLVLTR